MKKNKRLNQFSDTFIVAGMIILMAVLVYAGTITTTLNSPVNFANVSSSSVVFNCTASSTVSLTNVSLFHNSTGTWHRNETLIAGVSVNQSHNLTSFAAQPNNQFPTGAEINMTGDAYLSLVYVSSASDATIILIQDKNGGNLTSANIVGTYANFNNYSLESETTYRVLAWDNGGSFSQGNGYDLQTPPTPPQKTYLNWTAGFDNGGGRSGNVFAITEVHVVNGSVKNGEATFTKNLTDSGIWNCEACDSDGVCDEGSSNRTFSIFFRENSQTLNASANETQSQFFSLNITTLSSIINAKADLIYNGTSFSGTSTCSGTECIINATIDIPLINDALGWEENKTFYWELELFGSGGSSKFNATLKEQNVSKIFLEECNNTFITPALNFTAYIESNRSRLPNWKFNTYMEYWLGGGGTKRNNTWNNSTVASDMRLCLFPNSTTMNIEGQVQYTDSGTSYLTRDYWFENDTINSVTQNISLFLLNSTDSTTFILKVLDQSQNEVEGALISTQRWYPGIGEFKTVQIGKTDENGKTVGFFITEVVDYRFIIELNGVTELITEPAKVFPEDSPFTLTFTIGTPAQIPWIDAKSLGDLTTTMVFNNVTNVTTFTYIDASEDFTQGRLLVEKINFNASNTLICNVTSSDDSASLTCDATGYSGQFTAQGFITRTEETLVTGINFIISSAREIFGNTGLIMGWFIILTATLAFVWNPTAAIVAHNVAMILVSLIGLITFSPIYIFAVMGVSVILIIFLKT